MPTLICVPIMVQDSSTGVADALADARGARDAGADIVEFRVDHVVSGDAAAGSEDLGVVDELIKGAPLACIITCRIGEEGGGYDGPLVQRMKLFEVLAKPSHHPRPRMIDIELSTLDRPGTGLRRSNNRGDAQSVEGEKAPLVNSGGGLGLPDQRGGGIARSAVLLERDQNDPDKPSIIISMHDFAGRPADLSRRLVDADALAPSVIKVAYRARSLRDCLELLELPAQFGRPTIALGMGEFGLLSRVLAPKFGGFLTFASLRSASATAPGQPTIGELLSMYRFRSISQRTSVYGVVGYPVSHSLSPLVHNAGFEAMNFDGVYVPLPIPPGREGESGPGDVSLKATLVELVEHERLCLRGVSITLPHKESVVALARACGWELDPLVALMGAANTIIIDRGTTGKPHGVRLLNTDAPAIARAVERGLSGVHRSLRGARVLIVGAGGVARAAAFACAAAGASLCVANRRIAPARALAAAVMEGCGGGLVEAAITGEAQQWPAPFDVVIHCTPVGMAGRDDAADCAIDLRMIAQANPAVIIFDTVYTPLVTPLLRQAKELGLSIIDGAELFVLQAAAQFEAFTGGIQAPTELFDALVRRALERKDSAA